MYAVGFETLQNVPSMFVFLGNFHSYSCSTISTNTKTVQDDFTNLGLLLSKHKRILVSYELLPVHRISALDGVQLSQNTMCQLIYTLLWRKCHMRFAYSSSIVMNALKLELSKLWRSLSTGTGLIRSTLNQSAADVREICSLVSTHLLYKNYPCPQHSPD